MESLDSMGTPRRTPVNIDLFSLDGWGQKDDADDWRPRSIPTGHLVSNERGTNFRLRFGTEVAARSV